MMKSDSISLLFTSDLHFGAKHLNQEDMAIAFATTIFPKIPETDIFFINGDFFDDHIVFNDHGFDPIYDTILNLFALCQQYGTVLRVMRGTWSHDFNQCKRLEAFYRNNKCTFDFRFFDGIDIEVISVKGRDLRVFYIPDDMPYKTAGEQVDVVKNKMTELGWDYVDYGCMHGFFDFTFPKNVSQDNVIVFNKDQFPFVRKIINVGHVHRPCSDDNVFSNGSFDRLAHGEEECKGALSVTDYPDHYTARFVENTRAAIFDTLTFTSKDDTESLSRKIQSHIDNRPTERTMHLRFMVATNDQYEAIREWMRAYHPTVKISRKKVSDKEQSHLMIPKSTLVTPKERKVAPTPATLPSFIRNYIPEDYVLSIDSISTYLET